MAVRVEKKYRPIVLLMDRVEKRKYDLNKDIKKTMKTYNEASKSKRQSKDSASVIPKTRSFMDRKPDFSRFQAYFRLDQSIMENIYIYVQSLIYAGSKTIGKSLFKSQMKRHFNLTDDLLLERMHQVCACGEPTCHIDNYVDLICIFMTEMKPLKVKFVFRVYNSRDNGLLTRHDLEYFILPMVSQMSFFEGMDVNYLKNYVDLLMFLFDKNKDNSVDLEEFFDLVKDNSLMMECLGPCLPSVEDRNKFFRILSEESNLECEALFRFERRLSLRTEQNPQILRGIQKYYPVTLKLAKD